MTALFAARSNRPGFRKPLVELLLSSVLGRGAALIGLQQMAESVGAAARVPASIAGLPVSSGMVLVSWSARRNFLTFRVQVRIVTTH
jgi:hypothetical protein